MKWTDFNTPWNISNILNKTMYFDRKKRKGRQVFQNIEYENSKEINLQQRPIYRDLKDLKYQDSL